MMAKFICLSCLILDELLWIILHSWVFFGLFFLFKASSTAQHHDTTTDGRPAARHRRVRLQAIRQGRGRLRPIAGARLRARQAGGAPQGVPQIAVRLRRGADERQRHRQGDDRPEVGREPARGDAVFRHRGHAAQAAGAAAGHRTGFFRGAPARFHRAAARRQTFRDHGHAVPARGSRAAEARARRAHPAGRAAQCDARDA